MEKRYRGRVAPAVLAGLASLAGVGGDVKAEDVHTYSDSPVWVADGESVNRAYLWLDNTGLEGSTFAVEFSVFAPDFFYHSGGQQEEWGRPSAGRDFFEGEPTDFTWRGLNGINERSDYAIGWGPGVGMPPGTSGDVYYYDLVASQDSPFGLTGLTVEEFWPNAYPDGVQAILSESNPYNIMVVPTLDDFVSQMQGPGVPATDQRYNLENGADPSGDCSVRDLAEMQRLYSFEE